MNPPARIKNNHFLSLLKNNVNLFAYIAWLIVSTTFLLAMVIAIDMYFGYRELKGLSAARTEQVERVAAAGNNQTNEATSNKASLHSPHEVLGWTLNKNVRRSSKLAGNFDVIYTTDSNGFRTTPDRPYAKLSIYFFGDSFTFGHGVADEETFASIVSSVWLDEHVKIVNAGVNGYGITQMYGRFLEVLDQLKEGDIVIFTPISKDLLRSYKDFTVPAHHLFAQETRNKSKFYPYFENGKIKQGKLDTFANRIKGLLFHAPLTGNAFRKIHRKILGAVDFNDAKKMFALAKTYAADRGAHFYLYFLPQVKDLIRGRYKYDISMYEYVDIWNYFPKGTSSKEKIGFPDDGHWNCRGHEIAAFAIVDTLVKNGGLAEKYLRRDLDSDLVSCDISGIWN